ncbi:MBF complex negative regulatory component Yox1 [Schizosaccharomyces cryophilus OY26]|uniref:MBF complex negative regulatory component Yox1 n=1 Tax=Schizosaccharomyces cryophilus (strain OY26 / ATCC MYA-4695 / CBS 11777 / NBRC 106824 / NRRL Y48691) TaxID=653667 RepID=S9W155_SCHCR|nr:MBF complex negative regulatory component Yox1 [Schizosaccharomyces cryophilus OY26]EPY52219.1 MBF complex negative regulatory component Yox1 [Schizosaccharomyces cryophilus OY26]
MSQNTIPTPKKVIEPSVLNNHFAKDQEDEDLRAKRRRRRTTDAEASILEQYFLKTPKPNLLERQELSKKLNSSMSPRELQIWFQNKRQSLRRNNSLLRGRSDFEIEGIAPKRKSMLTLCESQNGEAELFFLKKTVDKSTNLESKTARQTRKTESSENIKTLLSTKADQPPSPSEDNYSSHKELEECAKSLIELQQRNNHAQLQ